jgi:hypothetical protein
MHFWRTTMKNISLATAICARLVSVVFASKYEETDFYTAQITNPKSVCVFFVCIISFICSVINVSSTLFKLVPNTCWI